MERRQCKRFPIRMKVKVQPIGAQNFNHPIEAWTRDLNPAGLLVEMKKRLSPNARLMLILQLPADAALRPVMLVCTGRVVRSLGSAAGLVIEKYEFVRALDD